MKAITGMLLAMVLGLSGMSVQADVNTSMFADTAIIIDGGVSKWGTPPDRLWWQSGYDNEKKFESYYARVGIFAPVTTSLSVGVSAFTLGRTKMTAEATQDEDKHEQGLCPAQCKAPDLYQTENGIYGFSLTGRYVLGSNWEVEGGLTYYRHSFQLKASEIHAGSQYGNTPTEYQEAIWSVGSTFGLAYTTESQYRIGAAIYMGGAGGNFSDGAFPAGTGDFTYVAFVGKKF